MVEPRIGRQRRVAPVELGYHGVGLALQVIETAFQKLQQLSQIGRRIVAVTTMENGLPEGEGQFLGRGQPQLPIEQSPRERHEGQRPHADALEEQAPQNDLHEPVPPSEGKFLANEVAGNDNRHDAFGATLVRLVHMVLISSRHQLFCSAS